MEIVEGEGKSKWQCLDRRNTITIFDLIRPNYRAVRQGFSKILGQLMVKYLPTCIKDTLKRTYEEHIKRCLCDTFVFLFSSDFLHKSICCCYSF